MDSCGSVFPADKIVDSCGSVFPADKIVDSCGSVFPADKIVDSCGSVFPADKIVEFRERKTVELKLIDPRLEGGWFVPKTKGSAGIDMYCCNDHEITVRAGDVVKVALGVAVAIPQGFVGLLTPRSSAGSRGFALMNTLGVIDSDYRGELVALLTNTNSGGTDLEINPMDRLVQLVVVPHFEYHGGIWITDDLGITQRGVGGFGSTG